MQLFNTNRHIVAMMFGGLLRIMVFVSVPLSGWAATPDGPLNEHEARWLLTRVGFAPTGAELRAIMALPNKEAAVDSILDNAGLLDNEGNPVFVVPQPAWTSMTNQQFNTYLNPNWNAKGTPTYVAAQEAITTASGDVARQALRNWWAVQMSKTHSPLTERMVLRWHNLFPASDDWLWMFHQTDITIRKNALGSYAVLLKSMIHDPGLIQFLGQQFSTASYPVANMARELMELFSIGIGNYTETDVIEVSKALTGLTIDPVTYLPYYNPAIHDNSVKTILGQTGNWGPDDVINILLQQSSLAPRIVSLMWMEFISPNPDPQTVNTIAASFKQNWQIKPMLRQLFLSDAFWNQAYKGQLVKSPAEFIIGAVRADLHMVNPDDKANQGTDLVAMIWGDGEPMWMPPNVRGFLTGTDWINTSTLVDRQQSALQLVSQWETEVLDKKYTTLPMVTPQEYQNWSTAVMGDQPILIPPTQPVTIVGAAKQILRDPAYWLK